MDAVEAVGLEKRYGKQVEALRGVDLSVRKGEVFGLVGPNGAGKTTLIKALVGSLRPSGGRARVLGLDPLRDRPELRRRIGYMPQSPVLYDDLPALENVEFFGAAHGVPGLRGRAREALRFVELEERAKDPVHTLSGGMKNRVSLACALVHEPEMLFLDEPTAGVDPRLRSRFWAAFRELARGGATLFISTHLMDEATLCDRVAVLRQGRVVVSDSPRGILRRGRTRLRVREGEREEERLIGGRPEDLAEALRGYGLRGSVSAVSVEADSLEQVVLSIIGEEAG
ncbi:ABC transporter related [Rubrobacter xylanophilus DSM 9941]|uniref:ABC transporter related n=1 Tax=Rubrobacter xylanophilus (strain DSM 9941 / JCM 11954 / NBRC 16129 / PRD-1) TaxID=266117 RepID=Q1AYW5_RUBXD|nr:ABC transporter ATP-binding protein [Rubrobacter xylanophilus]ABG03413.1 ABC transporter related [Rubrobacter xylanophilus DSM 9941]